MLLDPTPFLTNEQDLILHYKIDKVILAAPSMEHGEEKKKSKQIIFQKTLDLTFFYLFSYFDSRSF